MTRTLGQLTIISEYYPQLKAQELYQNLMVQLEGGENRIAVARGGCIKATKQYNVTIHKFPATLTAKVMDYTPKKNYLPDDVTTVSKVPTIGFSQNANAH